MILFYHTRMFHLSVLYCIAGGWTNGKWVGGKMVWKKKEAYWKQLKSFTKKLSLVQNKFFIIFDIKFCWFYCCRFNVPNGRRFVNAFEDLIYIHWGDATMLFYSRSTLYKTWKNELVKSEETCKQKTGVCYCEVLQTSVLFITWQKQFYI